MKIQRFVITWVASLLMAAGMLTGLSAQAAKDPVIVGYIGSFDSDSGKSTIRGAEIAIEELNAAGGVLGGRPIKLVKADTREDVTEGIKAYEYLAETAKVDFVISGSIDDVSLGWLPRMAEYRIPTLDTWTSYVGIIDMVISEYDKYKMYFMNVACDYALATLYVDFGKDVLAKKMGWKTTVVLQEDTAFGGGVFELVDQMLAPEAGIKIIDHIVYDTNTVDFAPIFNKAVKSKPDFLYLISSVRSQVPSSQYVKLQVPAGQANPSPPIGPALGQQGLNIMEFCKAFNAHTQGQEQGAPIPTVITVYADRTFSFVTKTPPASHFIKQAAMLEKASSEPGREVVGLVKMSQLREIAAKKMIDLNANDIDAACRMLAGTARSMGIQVTE